VRRLPLLAVLLLAGCGGSAASVVTVTKTAPSPRSCSRIEESPIVLCHRTAARFYTTAFYRTRDRRLVALPIAHPPGSKVGHWATAYVSPDRKTLLAQWSAECETPQAFFVAAAGGVPRALGGRSDESIAHGWTSDGRAIVEFPHGVCGGTVRRPGVYLVSLDGTRQFLAAAE
jgi:hypothetical protein